MALESLPENTTTNVVPCEEDVNNEVQSSLPQQRLQSFKNIMERMSPDKEKAPNPSLSKAVTSSSGSQDKVTIFCVLLMVVIDW